MGSKGNRTRAVVLDLEKYVEKEVHVKFLGGRQVRGLLKGWDTMVNVVLDNTVEEIRDSGDPYKSSGKERKLGLLVARGSSVMTIAPVEGTEEISNPFTQPEAQV